MIRKAITLDYYARYSQPTLSKFVALMDVLKGD